MASHLVVSSCCHVYSLKMCSFLSCFCMYVLYGSSGDTNVISVAMVTIGNDSGGGFVQLICGLVLTATNSQPS